MLFIIWEIHAMLNVDHDLRSWLGFNISDSSRSTFARTTTSLVWEEFAGIIIIVVKVNFNFIWSLCRCQNYELGRKHFTITLLSLFYHTFKVSAGKITFLLHFVHNKHCGAQMIHHHKYKYYWFSHSAMFTRFPRCCGPSDIWFPILWLISNLISDAVARLTLDFQYCGCCSQML